MPSKKSHPTFAITLAELETIASRLENNDTPLEQSLTDFEHGIQLIRRAQKALQEAEQKVHMLLETNAEPVERSLAANEDEDGE